MANGTKKTTTRKKTAKAKVQKVPSLLSRAKLLLSSLTAVFLKYRDDLLSRRPHRSFQRTRRRDYLRGLVLPGYFALTVHTFRTLQSHWRTFLLLVIVYTLVIIVAGGITSQNSFTEVRELLTGTTEESASGIAAVGEAALVTLSTFASLPTTITVEQQVYLALGGVFVWLCTVWLLREFLLKRSPRLRDGLYNSGGPFIATLIITIFIAVQLVPLGLLAVGYASLLSTGVVDSGFGAMIFWVFATLVATLVAYWITSSLFALVIITLPGMYPLRAMRMASDIVLGRRLRILYRLLWGAFMLFVAWVIIIVPVAIVTSLASSALPWIESIPITPYLGAILTAVSTVWYAAYVYLFYRKVVDND